MFAIRFSPWNRQIVLMNYRSTGITRSGRAGRAVSYYGDKTEKWGDLVAHVVRNADRPLSITEMAAGVVAQLDPQDPRSEEAFQLTRRAIMSGLYRGLYRRQLGQSDCTMH